MMAKEITTRPEIPSNDVGCYNRLGAQMDSSLGLPAVLIVGLMVLEVVRRSEELYDSWIVHVTQGQFNSRIGPTDFPKVELKPD